MVNHVESETDFDLVIYLVESIYCQKALTYGLCNSIKTNGDVPSNDYSSMQSVLIYGIATTLRNEHIHNVYSYAYAN